MGEYLLLAIRSKNLRVSSDIFFKNIAPVGRWFLILMYFFGVFHKLNYDWFDPNVSCAVALWKRFVIPLPFGLANEIWAQYCAIYGTLIIESIIMLLLINGGENSKWAIWAGLCFHGLAIGMNTFAHYWNFSSMSFALHFLFLPPSTALNWERSHFRKRLQSPAIKTAVCIPALLILYIAHNYFIWDFVIWFIFTICTIAFVIIYADYTDAPSGISRLRLNHSLLASGAVALFFLSCISPYLGLRTEDSLSMFSNLYTENNNSNHILLGHLPALFDYQTEVVNIVQTSAHPLEKYEYSGKPLLLHELQLIVYEKYKEVRKLPLSYILNGTLHVDAHIEDDPLLNHPNYLLMKLFMFKPLSRSRHCRH